MRARPGCSRCRSPRQQPSACLRRRLHHRPGGHRCRPDGHGRASRWRRWVPAAPEPRGGPQLAAARFPCDLVETLDQGIPVGQIRVGSGIKCDRFRGPGSISLTVRIQQWDPNTLKWHTKKAKTGRWTTPRRHHDVGILWPCSRETFRGTYSAVLRRPSGVVVARRSVKSTNIRSFPGCTYRIG